MVTPETLLLQMVTLERLVLDVNGKHQQLAVVAQLMQNIMAVYTTKVNADVILLLLFPRQAV